MANPAQRRLIGGEYIWTGTLGAGSFATVFRAQHKTRRNEVAIKSISRERLNRKLQENLESEISILLNFRHPNIVELYDIKKTERHIYLVCELCAGGDLQKFIRRHKRLAEPVARHFMRHLTAGLRFLWQQSLIHRDLKPQNLLLTSTEPTAVLKIADFGFARHLAAASMAETLCGSPLYMAPEVLQGRRYDAKADLWSVGTILYEMVVGRPPFGGANHVELLRCIHSRPLSVPEDIVLSDGCLDVLRLLLRRDPLQRASFEDFFAHPFVAPEPAAAAASAAPAAAAPAAAFGAAGLSERWPEPPSPSRAAATAAAHAMQMQTPPSSGRYPASAGGAAPPQGGEDAAALAWQQSGHRYAQQEGRPLHSLPQPAAANASAAGTGAARTLWPVQRGGGAPAAPEAAMFSSSDPLTGSHTSSPPFAAGQQQQQQHHGGGLATAATITARAMPWHDSSVVPSGPQMRLSGRQATAARQGYMIPAAVAPQTPHHQPFKPLAASPPGGAAAAAASALLGRHGGAGDGGAWLPPPLSLGAPAYSPNSGGNGGSDSMTGSDDYVMVDQCLEPYPFHGQNLPLRPGGRLAHRLGSRAVATAAAVAAAAAAAAASASSGYIGIPRFSDASGMSHSQMAAAGGGGGGGAYTGRRGSGGGGGGGGPSGYGGAGGPQMSAAAAAAMQGMDVGGGGGGGAARCGGAEAVVAVARCLHLVELFGRRAVLLAQLGDARVKAAREALQAGYVAGHVAAARRRASLAGNSLSASLLFGPIDGLGDAFADEGCCGGGSGVLAVKACGGGLAGDGALLPAAAESKWEPLGAASSRGGTSMSAAEAAAPALQEQGLRLFGEALVLYLKSLGMIRTAATWGQQAVGGSGGVAGGGGSGTAVEEQFARGRSLLLWLRQQSSAVLDRADQCKARLKEREKAPALLQCTADEGLPRGGGGGGAENDGVIAASVASVGPAAVGAMAVSAEYLVFDAALRLAQEGAVVELLGQFAEGRDRYDKACILIETLLLDGSVERPGGPANRRNGGGYGVTYGGGDAAFTSGASRSNIVAGGGGGGGGGAAGSLCESERRTLHSYLESFARRAEHLAREADAAAMADPVAAGQASPSQAPLSLSTNGRGAVTAAAVAGASVLGGTALR